MMRSYMFLMDFLEAVTKETSSMLKSQQSLMRTLLEAAKVSEAKLTDFFSSNIEKVSYPSSLSDHYACYGYACVSVALTLIAVKAPIYLSISYMYRCMNEDNLSVMKWKYHLPTLLFLV